MLKNIIENIDINKIKYSITVKDLKTGVSYNYNEKTQVSSASTIKLMIMAEVMNQVKKGILSLSQRIVVKKEDKVLFSILTMLDSDNSYSLKDIITLMIVQSDNTATNILIDMAGIENINRFIKHIGLKNTVLQRKMLDYGAKKEGRDNLTTSLDMSAFLELLYNGKVVDKDHDALMVDIMKMQLDRSMLYLDIPDDVEIAHKSGELDNIDHEVGIFYTKNRNYIFCMLSWDAESNNYARKTVAKVAKIVYDYF